VSPFIGFLHFFCFKLELGLYSWALLGYDITYSRPEPGNGGDHVVSCFMTHPNERKARNMIKTGIIGAKGYTARELLVYLSGHPEMEVTALMARVESPEPVEKYHPRLRGIFNLPIEPVLLDQLQNRCRTVFLALPHTVAQQYMPELISMGLNVIDLSADFRFDSVELYESAYDVTHLAPELNATIPYALPELFRDSLAGAQAVACPGCYPTSALLALAPLMTRESHLDLDGIVINSLSGISGAGRAPKDNLHFPNCNESVTAYGVAGHRHRPEIEEKLSCLAGHEVRVTFTPHLLPVNRGIYTTISIRAKESLTAEQVESWYRAVYDNETFVRLHPAGEMPEMAAAQGTNFCDIGWKFDPHHQMLICCSSLDNLGKGASSQAVQACNIIHGFPEQAGLLPKQPVMVE
jgi:N-acetyl-gamma-glutamyl-phosphate reductase